MPLSLQPYLADPFLTRVIRAYHLAIGSYSEPEGSLWVGINGLRQPIHDALMRSDTDYLRTAFADPVTTDLFYGTDNLASTIEASQVAGSDAAAAIAHYVRIQIGTLTHAMGLVRWVPAGAEQYAQFRAGHLFEAERDIDDLLDDVGRCIDWTLSFPTPFRGERGLATKCGLASYRAVHALYQAFRIKQEIRTARLQSVLEIGPGMGRTAYFAVRAGVPSYATVDLPLGVVAQACFLGATLGPDAIWMIGDDMPTLGRVRLLPSTALDTLHERFGLVVNVDSITEMGPSAAARYADWIKAHAEVFLSINHESNQATIPALAKTVFAGTDYRRFPYWMRPAYAEEIFRMTPLPSRVGEAAESRGRWASWLKQLGTRP